MTEFSIRYPENKTSASLNQRRFKFWTKVAQGHSELGLFISNRQNTKGIMQRVDKLGLEVVDLIPFQTHIYLRRGHLWLRRKKLVLEDLAQLPTVRFTKEKMSTSIIQRTLSIPARAPQMFHVTDRATRMESWNGQMLMRRDQAFWIASP